MNKNRVLTVNKTGAMVTNISDISKQFISDTQMLKPDDTVIDIGCCYGIASLSVLKQSKCKVIGMDLAEAHMKELMSSINEMDIDRFKSIVGRFPEDLTLKNNSIAAVHASHLLQFLSGEELTQGIKLIASCLRPGGKAYLTTTSIYCPWLEDYLPIYKKRKANGETWPGEINNFTDYAPEEAKAYIPDFFHALTKDKLESILVCNHFTIEKIYYYDLDAPYIHADDNKEMIGVIVRK